MHSVLHRYAEGMIKYWKRGEEGPVRQIDAFEPDTWVYVIDPTQDELDVVAEHVALERDLLQDAVDPNEVPRLQHEAGALYLFSRAPSGEGDETRTIPLLLVITDRAVVTVTRKKFSWLERFLHENRAYNTAWRSQLAWRMLLALHARYQNAITDIARRVRSGMAMAHHEITNEDILRLIAYEGVLNDLLGALVPINAILSNIAAGKYLKLYEEDRDLMEDTQLAFGQVTEAAKGQLKTTVNFRDAYSLIATNNLNRIIKLLTLVTVALTVPMVVSGLYGMNVRLPLATHPNVFWILLGSTSLFVVGVLTILWKKRLL